MLAPSDNFSRQQPKKFATGIPLYKLTKCSLTVTGITSAAATILQQAFS